MGSIRCRGFSVLVLLVSSARGDNLYGPVLGLVADLRGGVVLPIRGIPGAASLGDALQLGDVNAIAVSPRQNSAVLMTNTGTQVASLGADGKLSTVDAGLPAAFRPTVVRFSPTGMTAAFYDVTTNELWVKRDGVRQLDTSQLPAALDHLAVSDLAQTPVAGTLAGDHRSVFLMDDTGGIRRITGFTEVTDVSFVGGSGALAIADGGAKQVMLVRDPLAGNAPELQLELAGTQDGRFRIASSNDGNLLALLAVPASGRPEDGRPLYVVPRRPSQPGNPVLGLLRLADRQWIPLECACVPSDLVPLNGNAVYRLTDRLDRPLWILDGDSAAPRLVFVPAVQK
jgi:hypothetical protein